MKVISPRKARDVSAALRRGDLDLPTHYRSLHKHFEKTEPFIQAFLPEEDRFQRLNQAAYLLQTRSGNLETLPPLFGIPVGVKDIFHVKGKPTQAGSQLPPRALRGHEARAVSLLKKAGALVMGKTVTTEFAYFAPGPTRNPHSPLHTPGGSSSGSAAAVGADLVPLALGTQTIGSIIRPASFCGTVGFKPSYGRISTEGVIPLSPSLDHVGLFACDVETAQMAAAVLIEDWEASHSEKRPELAVPGGAYLARADGEMLRHFRAAVEHLREAGYWVKEMDPMPDFEDIVERHNLILAGEAARVHQAWFSKYGDRYHARTAQLIEKGQAIGDEQIKAAKGEAREFSLRLSTLMDIHGIDLWLAPAAPGAAPKGLESTGDPVMNLPWTQAGLPALGLPFAMNKEDLPLGLQLIADNGRDEDLFAWGTRISQALAEAA
jgi:Asp-tRNA(Asn)/Glu-tRNA(Gln) amidotransferase A subunit family amidase